MSKTANNIVFLNPDDPSSAQALANAVRSGLGDALSLGLIVKIDQHDRVVNWMLADAEVIKTMAAFALPQTSTGESGESQ